MNLQFHWMLPKGGEERKSIGASARVSLQESSAAGLPDLETRVQFCRLAEEEGIDSVLVPFSVMEPDPMLLTLAMGLRTERLGFILACRSGLMAPALFVQQINTLSTLIGGRIALNVVAGHSPQEQQLYGDYLPHDERYRRTDELLTICHSFWQEGGIAVTFQGEHHQLGPGSLLTPFVGERPQPEIYIAGHAEPARDLAIRHGGCWVRFPDTPENLRQALLPMARSGTPVGLRMGVIVRPTRGEAVEACTELIAGKDVREKQLTSVTHSDSQSIREMESLARECQDGWLTPVLWAGAVPYHGAPSMALVGSPMEVAEGLLQFRDAGVSRFILHGWPKRAEMVRFCREVLPLVRAREAA